MPPKKRQQGAALVISLMLLLTLSLATLGSLKMAILQEKMARNHRDQQIAFQKAEAVLAEAEHFVLQQKFTDAQHRNNCADQLCFTANCGQGLCRSTNYTEAGPCDLLHSRPWQEKSTWLNAQSHRRTSLTAGGRYIIEFRCFAMPTDETAHPAPRYRITALASGGTRTAQVMLQSTLQLPPPAKEVEKNTTQVLAPTDQNLDTLRPRLRDSWRQLTTLSTW